MAYDTGLAQRVRDCLEGTPSLHEKAMFGGLAFLVPNGMFVGISGDDLMVRIGSDAQEHALRKPHVRPMDFTGRPMKAYVFVGEPGTRNDEELAYWVNAALAFVRALPLPAPKPASKAVSTAPRPRPTAKSPSKPSRKSK